MIYLLLIIVYLWIMGGIIQLGIDDKYNKGMTWDKATWLITWPFWGMFCIVYVVGYYFYNKIQR